MSSFGMDDIEPEFTDPYFPEPDASEFGSPTLEDLDNEFAQNPVIPETSPPEPQEKPAPEKKSSIIWDDDSAQLKNDTPPASSSSPEPEKAQDTGQEKKEDSSSDPAGVDTSSVDVEEKSPQFDFGDDRDDRGNKESRENEFTDKQREVFGDYEPPANATEPPVYDQKITDTIPSDTKNLITQALVILFVCALMFGMIMVFRSKDSKNQVADPQISENPVITDSPASTEVATTESAIKSNKWEPGIIGQTQATTQASTVVPATSESVTEATTEAPTTEAPAPPSDNGDATDGAGTEGTKPSDPRFADVSELTLYIQNSATVVYRKEQELVQDYVDGRTDKNGFLETMGTYSTAMDELSRLLILNRPCYDGDPDTYNALESSVSKGMSYADRSLSLAGVDTPLSDFKNQLGE